MTDFKNKPYQTSERKNKHKRAKKRELLKEELSYIKRAFKKANGQLSYGFCSKIRENLSPDISVFQVSGACRYFHAQVKSGKMSLKDMKAYKKFINAHRKKWKTYNSEKYQPLIKYKRFFEFYQDYKVDIDRMIWQQAYHYQSHYDPCEMFSEILFRLLKSNVINDYKKEKRMKFKNYLYKRVWGYASHIYDEHLRNCGSKKEKKTEDNKNSGFNYNTRIRTNKILLSYEGLLEEDSPFLEKSITAFNNIANPQEIITLREMKEYAKKELSANDYTVLNLKLAGFMNKEIAVKIKKTKTSVVNALRRIREKLEKFKEA